MRDVVLLYEGSCPNVRTARSNLLRAFSLANVPASWREVDLEAPDTPLEWRMLGSPTVLVDGTDVGGGTPAAGATCRLYEHDGRVVRAPSVERIVAHLHAGASRKADDAPGQAEVRASTMRTALASVPGVGVALLPKVLCPACWPAYAAVLSAVGLGFLMKSEYLVPITIALLALATFAIGLRARMRRGYRPAMLAGAAGVTLVVGKFVLDSNLLTYAATGAFASAAIWNAWPVRRTAGCPACASESPTEAV